MAIARFIHACWLAVRALALLSVLVCTVATASQPLAVSAQTETICPNNAVVNVGEGCPPGPKVFTCPDGTVITSVQSCPLVPTPFTCPGGAIIPPGQTCGQTSYPYCNGSYAFTFATQPCGTTTYTACPGGQLFTAGQTCSTGFFSVTYSAGWNIVAGPPGTIITGNSGPLFTLSAGASTYLVLPSGSPLQSGAGYWAYFPTSATASLAAAALGNVTVQVPAGQAVLIGNPGNSSASVSGAGITVLVYDPTSGSYSQTNQLAAGQGAWAISASGGQVTITSGVSVSPLTPLSPPPPLIAPPPLPAYPFCSGVWSTSCQGG